MTFSSLIGADSNDDDNDEDDQEDDNEPPEKIQKR